MDINIIISSSSSIPIYEQIAKQIKTMIRCGKLLPGDSLPAIRVMAKQLQIGVVTVQHAYELLQKEGFIDSTVGRGSFVANINPNDPYDYNLSEIKKMLMETVKLAKDAHIGKTELLELLEECYKKHI
ncbi:MULTISPECIES: GntR family transcriptional regulator [Faecalibacterium]|uniref:GntR family transcriptional regulator n=1 Tax=Faecalibacterium gallinarum TaxID=2903556 RepID=A0AA37IZE1_9FIRM|nr:MULTISPECIES: GntR family transcriptional regulator [Faecalibacterium]GJN65154.1 GntR family transcriptional regulator [Faecalibacterium gallinarum]